MPPVRDRGAARAQFGLSRSNATPISSFVGTHHLVPIFPCSLSFGFQLVCMPREPTLGSSSYGNRRSRIAAGCRGNGTSNAFIQCGIPLEFNLSSFTSKKRAPERASRDLLNRVADCLGRCGKISCTSRFLSSSSCACRGALPGGAIVKNKTGHFTFQSACPAARQHIVGI